ncbi:MAG: type II toxin-antitoxin system VapC family toxin [Bacteroidota bacterium]
MTTIEIKAKMHERIEHLTEDQIKKAQEVIVDLNNSIYVSIVSLWEIAIKLSIGKLELTKSIDDLIEGIDIQGYTLLPISVDTVKIIENLPFHHRDPFDRLLIAQAKVDDLTIITSDDKFEGYDIKRYW